MKLVLASDNKNKLREFRTLFENFGVELISKAEYSFTEEVEETGETFAENAASRPKPLCGPRGFRLSRTTRASAWTRSAARPGRAFRALYRKS